MDEMNPGFDDERGGMNGGHPSDGPYCPELTTLELARKEGLGAENVLGCLVRQLWADHWNAVQNWKDSKAEGERPRRTLMESVRSLLETELAERKEDLVRVIDRETLQDVVDAKNEIKMLTILCRTMTMAAENVEQELRGWDE